MDDQTVPALFSQLVQDGKIMSHPEIRQHREIPPSELDPDLKIMVQTDMKKSEVLDPNAPMTHTHVLAPLASRAAMLEQAMTTSPPTVSIRFIKPKIIKSFICPYLIYCLKFYIESIDYARVNITEICGILRAL